MTDYYAPFLARREEKNRCRILKIGENEVTIGNLEDVTYSVSSPGLFRCLFVIRRNDEACTIADIMSAGGIYVNGHQLAPLLSYPIQNRDLVQFGALDSSSGQRKFEFMFCQYLKSAKIQELDFKRRELEQLQNVNLAMHMYSKVRQPERALLLAEVDESRQEATRQMKNDVVSTFTELMDATLQCSICTEYVIKATHLNCSHVFCNLCITNWVKIRKQCPNCRTPVTTMTQNPALDQCIDRMVDQFSDDIRRHRQELINERNIAKKKTDDAGVSALNRRLKAIDRNIHLLEQIAAGIRAELLLLSLFPRAPVLQRMFALTILSRKLQKQRALRKSVEVKRAAAVTKARADATVENPAVYVHRDNNCRTRRAASGRESREKDSNTTWLVNKQM